MEDLTVCEKCNHYILEGDWPFCPHPHMDGTPMLERDEIPGGVTLENYSSVPMTFYSHSERRAYMAAHDLHEKETFCPAPGTDKDPQGIPNPKGYMDAKTMDNARVLLSRSAKPEREFDAVEAGVLKDLTVGVMTEQDAIAVASGDPRRQSRLARRMAHG